MSRNKRKAFTLTELLVVVVVIGVLAAVVLPKYTKVIETRKTTEAENMMAAVRTEQERRCALDKPYVTNISKLVDAGVVPNASTQNFYYTLQRDGMRAEHAGKYTYALRMPSYFDGRICCEGRDCNKLNKEYPNCDTLIAQVDYREAIDCISPDPGSDDPDEEPAPTCEELAGEKPADVAEQSCECGKVTAPYYCSNGKWEHEDFPACEERPIKDGDCSKGAPGARLVARCVDGAWSFSNPEVLEECPPQETYCLTHVAGCQELSVTVVRQIPYCRQPAHAQYECGNSYRLGPDMDITSEEVDFVHEQARKQVIEGGTMKLIPAGCEAGGECACEPGILYTTEEGLNMYQGTNGGCSFALELPDNFPSCGRNDNCGAEPWSTPRRATFTAKPEVPYYQCIPTTEDGCATPDVTCNVRQTCGRRFPQ